MPSINHEEAILVIRQQLMDEYNVTLDVFFDCNWKEITKLSLIPDLYFINPFSDKYVVIEVGNTSAEKIDTYLRCPKICEIRWYTKKHDDKVIMVSRWLNKVHVQKEIQQEYSKKVIAEHEYEKERNYFEREIKNMKVLPKAYVLCTGCGCHVKIQELGFSEAAYGHQYGVCPSCDKEGFFYSNTDFKRKEQELRFTVMQYLVNKRRELLST